MNIYEEYFKHFDANQKAMAASLPAITYCIKFMNTFQLESILDAGSGISTVMFAEKFENLTSIDTDPKWGSKTTDLIKLLLNKNVQILNSIEDVKTQKFDFVFYDFGNLEDRIFNFPKILALDVNYIYLDDMHILPYRYYIESKLKNGERLVFLPETIDDFGRFGAMITKSTKIPKFKLTVD
jgi:hypothetical protein